MFQVKYFSVASRITIVKCQVTSLSLTLIRKSVVITRDFSARNARGGNETRRREKVMVAT